MKKIQTWTGRFTEKVPEQFDGKKWCDETYKYDEGNKILSYGPVHGANRFDITRRLSRLFQGDIGFWSSQVSTISTTQNDPDIADLL